jgi:hypothetical protein
VQQWGLKGALGAGAEDRKGLVVPGVSHYTAWDQCGGKFASLYRGLPLQVIFYFFTASTGMIIIYFK